jgi:membrane protein YqaA with SNARE-associated domain
MSPTPEQRPDETRTTGAGNRGTIRRFYDWVLHWSDTPHGLAALFLIAFAEASFFPIPPDVLLLALCLGAPRKAFRFALWCSVASVLGGMVGYGIGFAAEPLGRWLVIDLLGYGDAWEKVAELYGENAFLAILTAAFTPIPFKVFTIAAGVFHDQVGFWTLVTASAVGRSGRFLLVAGAIYVFGPPIKRLLDRYLEWFTIGFTILLIGGFVLIKYFL